MKKSKKEKIEKRLKRIQKVIDGKMSIDDLGLKELKLMYKVVEQIAEDRALEEIKDIKPEQLH